MPENMLSGFLKSKRIAAGLSQRDVADNLGYSTPQFISNWERGISCPPINALKKLGEMYKVSADDLFETVLNQEINELVKDLKRKYASSKAR